MNKETFIKKWNPATLENEERLGTLESEFLKDVESLCNEIFSDGEEAGFEQARENRQRLVPTRTVI